MAIENVVVFGVGAAGSNTFLHLLYAYPDFNFTVVDFDVVESRNVDPGTQPYTSTDLRRPKVQALQRIAVMSKKKKITAVNKKVESVEDIKGYVPNPDTTLILDAFDNVDSRNLFTELGAEYNVIHIGFSAVLSGEAVWNGVFTPMTESKADADIDVCEMALARPFIFALCAMSSMAISRFVEKDEKVNLYLDTHFNIKSWS
jgi:hypothetical protein